MMSDYRSRFKSCGQNVVIESGAFIEHPEVFEVGDNVHFMRDFYFLGKPGVCRIGSNVLFYPNCFVQCSPGKFIIEDHVTFYPNTYIASGDWESSFVTIGHHSHFAPNCVLYGWGGLTIGPYCNIAAHTVFATVGHHDEITDKPMAFSGEKAGPITLVEDIWVGANCTITANTTIARGCVIGANAVVTKDCEEPFSVYAGVPARRLRAR